ncbi:unnamed protein product [Mytilus edulis]|uniref:Endonuclease/exonuclease/phosphatase domain-containing protein n=1 Tax=Mytilus edulis TaxID=6550 RepID=A0A8S3T8H9_MYTED|nr:unnamed protein product [Mytilus edulis]
MVKTLSNTMSVYVPQQEFIAKLDHDLADLPKETYISKLIEKTNNSDDCLTRYRSTLAGRAKSIQGCPTGKLFNRKSTTKSTSTFKYARDCYIIYMFLQGDKTQIDEVFRKDEHKLSVVDHNSEVVSNEIIEMRANIHILLERVSELEKSDQKNEKVIKILQTENNKLRTQYLDLNEQIVSHIRDYERKSTQNDTKFKVLSQSTKTLDDFDLKNFQQDIKTVNSELDRHEKLQSFLEVKGVNTTFIQLFHGKYNYSRISAKLNVTEESASIIETDEFWPAGVRSWNVRGIMSSTLCLAELLESTNCDIAIISEHKLKPNLLSYMNSIDMRYKSISKTDKLNDLYNCTHGKGGISILYKASLQFSTEEIIETNSDRIVGIELKNKSFGSHYINSKVVVAGDFNASCINQNVQFTNTIKSKEMQNFVQRHFIFHPFNDTCKTPVKGPGFTFTLKNTILDYILIDETLVRQLRRYEILEEGTFSSTSDHLPIIACVERKSAQSVNTLINTAKETIPCNTYNPYTKPYWNADVKKPILKNEICVGYGCKMEDPEVCNTSLILTTNEPNEILETPRSLKMNDISKKRMTILITLPNVI